MSSIILRIFSLYNVLNAFFLHLVPKKLRVSSPTSWYHHHHPLHHHHHPHHRNFATENLLSSHRKQTSGSGLPRPEWTRTEDDDMREAFNVFDQNGDGFITVEELKVVMQSLGLQQGRTTDDCKNMITKVDVDGDGRVNFNEFIQMMRGGGFAAFS